MRKAQQNMGMMIPERHPSLPKNVTNAQLAIWLENSAVEIFTDEQKRQFSPEELTDMEHESSLNGREMNRLNDTIKELQGLVKKGNDQPLTITIPVTIGTKLLEMHRRENDDFIEKGYETIETRIFGIPNIENHMMEYFDGEGNLIADRGRALSAKEKHEHAGFFANIKDNGDGTSTDQSTGEVLKNTGTE